MEPDVIKLWWDEHTYSLELRIHGSVRIYILAPVYLLKKSEIGPIVCRDFDRLKPHLQPAVRNTLIGHVLYRRREPMLSLT